MLNVDAYLARLNVARPSATSTEMLRRLQRAHLRAIPFENLSIMRGEPIPLDEASLFDKIVTRRRGGFCYELNGLFAALLRALGYRVTLLSARVANDGGDFSPEFDHLALRVDLATPWLVDVGFGDAFLEPLPLVAGEVVRQGRKVFRVDAPGPDWILHEGANEATLVPVYRFEMRPRELSEFEARCAYHRTSPESHFHQGALCTRTTPNGRVTLSGYRLIETVDGRRSETAIADSEIPGVLARVFGIEPPPDR